MMWILMCGIALAVGFMLFAGIQDDLPEELGILKSGATIAAPANAGAFSSQGADGWSVASDGKAVEISKRFNSGVELNGTVYDAPVLALLCDGESLFARIDTVARTSGVNTTEVELNGKRSKWDKAQGTNILAPDGRLLLASLGSVKTAMQVHLTYAELGRHVLEFEPQGVVAAASAFPPNCR